MTLTDPNTVFKVTTFFEVQYRLKDKVTIAQEEKHVEWYYVW